MARNIEALIALRREEAKKRTLQERCVDAVSAFVGSMPFLYLHAAFLIFWVLANTRHLHGIHAWDPYPFSGLSLFASVEAIFLSTFVLIGQKRQGIQDTERDELDLHVNLLAEHEVTRLVEMLEAVCRRLGIDPTIEDLAEIKRDVAPEIVISQIEEQLISDSPRQDH